MATDKEFRLTQTKGSFKLQGKVVGITKDNAMRSGLVEKGNNAGKEYRSVRFGVQTNETNTVYVEMFGMEQEEVRAWNAKNKVHDKFPWEDRKELPAGWAPFGVKVGLTREKGKIVSQTLVEFDAVETLHENLEEGDSVFASGEIQFSVYENPNTGEVRNQTKYVLKHVSRMAKPVDFKGEKFTEMASFEMDVVVSGVEIIKEPRKMAILTAMTIQYGDKFTVGNFVIDGDTHAQLAANMNKRLKFGDLVKIYGNCINSVETVEGEVPKDEDGDGWGGSKPKGYGERMVKNVLNELRITSIDVEFYENNKAKYKPEDFETPEPENDDPFAGGGDTKPKTGSDTFGVGAGAEPNFNDDDDVPF